MMRQRYLLLLILCFCFLYPCYSSAVPEKTADAVTFDIQKANRQFHQIEFKLASNDINLKILNKSISQLDALISEADQFIQNAHHKINDIDSQIKQYFGEQEKASKSVDANYLENQKKDLTKQLAECRLFKIRAEEVLEDYHKKRLSLKQEITFTRGKNIIQRLQQFSSDWQTVTLPGLEKNNIQDAGKLIIYFLPLLLLAGIISWRIRRLMHKKWRKKKSILAWYTVFIFTTLLFLLIFLLLPNPFIDSTDNALFQSIVLEFTLYILALSFFNFLFLLRRIPALLQWYGVDLRFLRRIGNTILSLYFFRKIGLNLLQLYQATNNILQLYENLMLVISLSAMLYFTFSFYRTHAPLFTRLKHQNLVYQLIIFIAFALLMLAFVGYSILAINAAHFIFALLMTAALAGLFFLGINKFYRMINYNPSFRWKLKKNFGYASELPFFELLILKILGQAIVIIGLLYLFARMIDEVRYYIDYFLNYLINGFHIAGFIVLPLQWATGLFIFCLFILFSRHIATKISRSRQFDHEEETQVALASIMLYAGFIISLIIALLVAGFSFTNLAIIAGALSVGIGLGLQSIVNNFFSGLILLIEKPIKAGDRIRIDNVEGFVKKVRVRSTQILTPTQEDIIIPNSDLITHQVTNYMFSDTSWRVKVSVGVAYGSDTELVRDLMMNAALAHPDVIKSPGKKPMVLFCSFGESALIFEAWCLIKDVNQKYIVASDLHFAIEKAFREHNITIAFPQRDVHVKFDKQEPPWKAAKK